MDNRAGDRLLRWFRRLRIRWEIRHETREAFMTLTAAVNGGNTPQPWRLRPELQPL